MDKVLNSEKEYLEYLKSVKEALAKDEEVK
nr:MAG: hypothetical protein [Bacteriophage sp.]